MKLYHHLRTLLLLLFCCCLCSTSRADVLVAEDFLYSQPTKAFGPGGGFSLQDYGGGQNGPFGQWGGRWISVGDGVITGTDITMDAGFNPETDMFQAATRNGLSANYLDRAFQPRGLANEQALYFGVTMRSTDELAMPVARMILNDPGGAAQISMGFLNGSFVGSLGETEDFIDDPELTVGLDAHILIGKLEVNALGNDERLTVWLDPTDVETAEQSVQLSADVLDGLSDLTGFLRLDHNFSSGIMLWDDVALGTSWDDVAVVDVPRAALLVDTTTRDVRLANQTDADFDLTFYQIDSAAGSLTASRWNSLTDQGVAGWLENSDTNNRLAESNFLSSTRLEPNDQYLLGEGLLRREQDLIAHFGTTDGLLNRMDVVYGEFVGPAPGDCNGDGVVDATDLACICGSTAGTLDDVLAATGLPKGDLNLNGVVDFPDFLTLSNNFGAAVESYLDGDIDCNGQVAFPDFLALADNFGASGAAAAAVPEPSGCWLVVVALLGTSRGRHLTKRRSEPSSFVRARR